jgi:hypothetical protein
MILAQQFPLIVPSFDEFIYGERKFRQSSPLGAEIT